MVFRNKVINMTQHYKWKDLLKYKDTPGWSNIRMQPGWRNRYEDFRKWMIFEELEVRTDDYNNNNLVYTNVILSASLHYGTKLEFHTSTKDRIVIDVHDICCIKRQGKVYHTCTQLQYIIGSVLTVAYKVTGEVRLTGRLDIVSKQERFINIDETKRSIETNKQLGYKQTVRYYDVSNDFNLKDNGYITRCKRVYEARYYFEKTYEWVIRFVKREVKKQIEKLTTKLSFNNLTKKDKQRISGLSRAGLGYLDFVRPETGTLYQSNEPSYESAAHNETKVSDEQECDKPQNYITEAALAYKRKYETSDHYQAIESTFAMIERKVKYPDTHSSNTHFDLPDEDEKEIFPEMNIAPTRILSDLQEFNAVPHVYEDVPSRSFFSQCATGMTLGGLIELATNETTSTHQGERLSEYSVQVFYSFMEKQYNYSLSTEITHKIAHEVYDYFHRNYRGTNEISLLINIDEYVARQYHQERGRQSDLMRMDKLIAKREGESYDSSKSPF